MNKRSVGTFYEDAVCNYLKKRKIRILQKNFRCHFGEIDLIGMDGEYLVFFEVKYRRTGSYGMPQEAVGIRKQTVICKCAAMYCLRHQQYYPIRYDVVAVLGTEIEWIQDAFPHRGYSF